MVGEMELRAAIASVAWRATTYIAPHEYIVKENCPEAWDVIAKAIDTDKTAYTKMFKGAAYKYLDIDGWRYWHFDVTLNRAKNE